MSKVSDGAAKLAAEMIRAGGVIVYPTDTVYGLGCNAFRAEAIQRVFAIKQRPENKPALVLVLDRAMLERLVTKIPPIAAELMECFWPGPLTIVLGARRRIHALLTAGSGKVGVRMPDNEFCRRLMIESGVPLVSTSANISGKESSYGAMKSQFGGLVDLFIEAGPPVSDVPSTVVDVSEGRVKIVREGIISHDTLREFIRNPA
ncbi:MAG TPA: L-threonylcarbamoyladenylate synthase [Bacteroidota bacterium]|nr:L-threonylcarbamoyladenylate synthase [Bacteroidota bacterium]